MQAIHACVQQIARDKAGNEHVLHWIASGQRLYSENGEDVTEIRRKDALRRLRDCDAILASFS